MIKNASQKPQLYYGLHMVEGVAEYRPAKKQPYRIFIGESVIKNMDSTFQGCPVYVRHVDEVDLENIQEEADGYVVRSFFNKADGKHWAEFMVVSDAGHKAIQQGWKLSNAYTPQGSYGRGGLWHGVEYEKEVMQGEYDHLAIVPNPRYEESIILTPEEFKKYCDNKELELERLKNSKEGDDMGVKLKFWKKQAVEKIENEADLASLSVTLPESKKEVTIGEMVTEYDKILNMQGYANGDHMVKVGEEELSVNDLVKKHMEVCNTLKELENEGEEEEDDEEKKKKNELEQQEREEKERLDNEAKEKKADDDKKKKDNILKIKNARSQAEIPVARVETSDDKLARGRERY